MNTRIRFLFSGVVQGVGFRPFIYRMAVKNGLGGFVQNRPDGVLVEAEGPTSGIESFRNDVDNHLPPMANIAGIGFEEASALGERNFRIIESDIRGHGDIHIPPDMSVCPDCLRELFDPADRRYRYPFINCTNCGPRLTIIRDVPYDRVNTAMACFAMCENCGSEYRNPADRRFHAEPVACPQCGPVLRLLDNKGEPVKTSDPVKAAIELLSAGNILAIKGLGGFHLSVDAANDGAVRRLRARKYREEKPLAVMARDLERARMIAKIGPEEEKLLLRPERPIVLVEKRASAPISGSVAPGLASLGIMLPYTPVHHLLMEGAFTALVMTSGNRVDEPICTGNREAVQRLNGIADFFLVHNRDILVRCDDSVAMVSKDRPVFFRRSRGFAPKPIRLKEDYPDVLALGPQLKGTLCILRGAYAFLSPHIGDLETPQARDFFHESLALMKRITESEPEVVACDMHPGYYSTEFAKHLSGLKLVQVQHHHAHIVACMADNGISGDVIGLAMDGTGYGTDGNAWGGEFLIVNEAGFVRKGHIKYFALPGGEKAIREPWRIAVSLLREAYGEDWPEFARKLNLIPDENQIALLETAMAKRINTPRASGLGRVFDGIAALVGLRRTVTFEGQAAMELEAVTEGNASNPYPFEMMRNPDGDLLLDLQSTVRAVTDDVLAGKKYGEISLSFHRMLHRSYLEMVRQIRSDTGLNRVVLSGGCFQNRILLEGCRMELEKAGFKVFTHRDIPANDGGISLGQAVIAGTIQKQKKEM